MSPDPTVEARVDELTARVERTTPPEPAVVPGPECIVCGAPATGRALCDEHEEVG